MGFIGNYDIDQLNKGIKLSLRVGNLYDQNLYVFIGFYIQASSRIDSEALAI